MDWLSEAVETARGLPAFPEALENAQRLLQKAAAKSIPKPLLVRSSGFGGIAIRFHSNVVWVLIECWGEGAISATMENWETKQFIARILGNKDGQLTEDVLLDCVKGIVIGGQDGLVFTVFELAAEDGLKRNITNSGD